MEMGKAIAGIVMAAVTAPVDIIDYFERRAEAKEIAEMNRRITERKEAFARLMETATMK